MNVQNNKKIIVIPFFLLSFFIFSCAQKPITSTQIITAYSTSSAQPWMGDLFACADEILVSVKVTAEDPDIYLRVGEPGDLLTPAFQIDDEELLIVMHRESEVQNLSLEEAQALFSGTSGLAVQVWVYPSELDLQGLFDQFVMQGRSVTSSARVAVNPQEMSDILNNETNAVGILPRHWKAGSVREVYSVGMFPVLALTREEPQGEIAQLIACLQK
jgi:hypothetical protein